MKKTALNMKIKFIGVGSAFTTSEYYQSNMLITSRSRRKMLVDCGSDARFALGECNINNYNLGDEIDAIYISHLHADHIGGMEWLACNTYFGPKQVKPKLFMEAQLMEKMWNNSLRGGLGSVEGKEMHLSDYFECRPLSYNASFLWEGIGFTLVEMPHVITEGRNHNSYGLVVKADGYEGSSVFITMDTQFQPDCIAAISEKVRLIFHDCETSPCKSIIHAHYEDLCTMHAEIKQKMWLYHYQPDPKYQPEADGFKGFIEKGQEFDFAEGQDLVFSGEKQSENGVVRQRL
jgi:ribonuclease BN (tRNA processing enzyme)